MPKTPVEVFWRGAGGTACVLRSTDRGWEVAVIAQDGHALKRERVSAAKRARLIADRWRRAEHTPDR
jgi:hypothetical protein